MTAIEPEAARPSDEDRIAVIAAAIVAAYGDEALRVAERQCDAAEPATRADWIAIVDRLQAR